MRHTPGPWVVQPSHEHPNEILHVVGPSEIVAGLDGICEPARWSDRTFEEDRANMRLIAAAPDLLEALKDAEEMLRVYLLDANPVCVAARSAIAKAEGRS